ncbi:MAG: hypothetical protein DRQ64_06920 [Gammaproteobacteria bacterium]|nr:MAG: hypothetical protein DRQ64_06920 [Gammaproteobacteria bacterium]
MPLPGENPTTQQRSADAKLAVVFQTGSVSESQRSQSYREKDLRIKEKALAETAALLVLRKKLNALWADEEY